MYHTDRRFGGELSVLWQYGSHPLRLTTYEGLKWLRYSHSLADGVVDEIKKLCLWVAHVQVGCLCCVHHRAPTHCQESVKLIGSSKRDGVFQATVCMYVCACMYMGIHLWCARETKNQGTCLPIAYSPGISYKVISLTVHVYMHPLTAPAKPGQGGYPLWPHNLITSSY